MLLAISRCRRHQHVAKSTEVLRCLASVWRYCSGENFGFPQKRWKSSRKLGGYDAPERKKEMGEILKKHGFSEKMSEWRGFHKFLPSMVENYITIMKESSFTKINSDTIENFRNLSSLPLQTLQNMKLISNPLVTFDSYAKLTELDSDNRRELTSLLPLPIEKMPLKSLREHFITFYCSKISGISEQELKESYVFRTKRLLHKSFEHICGIIDFLNLELGFPRNKIIRHLYLLTGNLSNMKAIASITDLCGKPIKEMVDHRPKILTSSYNSIIEIEKLLKHYGFSNESVLKCPEVFTFSHTTIEKRLKEMNSDPIMRSFRGHDSAIRILYCHSKVKKRLAQLDTLNMEGASLNMLSSNGKRFSQILNNGDLRGKGVDTINVLSKHFNRDRASLKKMLSKNQHWPHVPLSRVMETIEYLEEQNFSDENITKALPIVLYPKSKLIKEINFVIENNQAKPCDSFFLDMVLYYLEKPVHFTGDGIWPQESTPE